MVNLIPPSAKKGVAIEYWIRVLTVWSLIATVVAMILAITFLPVRVLVEAKIGAYEESAAIASEKIASFEEVSNTLNRSTEQAQFLTTNNKQKSLSEMVELLGSVEGGGIKLTSITIIREEGDHLGPVEVTGQAVDRQALADFRDQLLNQAKVEVVDFPISNLAKDSNIFFSITITMSSHHTL